METKNNKTITFVAVVVCGVLFITGIALGIAYEFYSILIWYAARAFGF